MRTWIKSLNCSSFGMDASAIVSRTIGSMPCVATVSGLMYKRTHPSAGALPSRLPASDVFCGSVPSRGFTVGVTGEKVFVADRAGIDPADETEDDGARL